MDKIKLFLDFDSTLVNTNEVALNILNNKYGTSYKIEELKKYDYSDLFPDVNSMILKRIFESDELFENITFVEYCFDYIELHPDDFDITIVTKSTENIDPKKALWLNENFPSGLDYRVEFIRPYESKSKVDMSGGIFIDDVTDNLLESNAPMNILYAPNKTEWNTVASNTNLFVVSSWNEINEILEFFVTTWGVFKSL